MVWCWTCFERITAGTLLGIGGLILAIILPIKQCTKGQHTLMEEFVKGYLSHMRANHPTNNVLTWHNHGNEPLSELHFVTQVAYELDVPCKGGEWYELLAFAAGNFSMDGDRGWINWGFTGNFTRDPPDGPDVEFFPLGPYFVLISDEDELLPTEERKRDGKSSANLPVWNAAARQTSKEWQPPAVIEGTPIIPEDLDAAPVRLARPAAQAKYVVTGQVAELVNDGTYFVHCNSTDDGFSASGVAYYVDFQPGENVGQLPDDFVWVDRGHSAHFRQSTGAVEFLGGAAGVQWSTFGGAMDDSMQPGRFAGTANDGVDRFFLYGDAGQQLFATSQYTCFSQYYAF